MLTWAKAYGVRGQNRDGMDARVPIMFADLSRFGLPMTANHFVAAPELVGAQPEFGIFAVPNPDGFGAVPAIWQ